MKHLLVLVTVVAVFTVEGRDFSKHPDGPDKTAANQEPMIPEDIEDQSEEQDSLDVSGGNNLVKILDSDNDVHQMIETEKEQHQRRLRRSKCKARNACVVMGGFCVTNATICGGRLVPEGCKGTNCQCCVPGTIEARFDNLEMELQSLRDSINRSNSNMNSELLSLKDSMDDSNSNLNSEMQTLKFNMTNSNTNLGSELQSLKDSMDNSMININNSNTNLGSELQSLKDSMDNSNADLNSEMQSIKVHMNSSDSNLGSELQSLKDNTNNLNTNLNSKLNSMNTNLNTKLASIAENQGCPDGLFKLSGQCFKFFPDTGRSWSASKSKCQDEGLLLAKPFNPLELRSYLAMRYGNKYAWIGGKGTGSHVKWDRDGQTISSSNPMWWSGYPGSYTSSSNCLMLGSTESYLKSHPTTPYWMTSCTSSWLYALCEYLMD